MALKRFTPEIPLEKDDETPRLTVADELLQAIKLAKEKEPKSSEVVVDLVKAKKLLKNLGYIFRDYKKGILLSFPQKLKEGEKPKSQIYVHDPT